MFFYQQFYIHDFQNRIHFCEWISLIFANLLIICHVLQSDITCNRILSSSKL